MNGAHDLGGMHGFGPVDIERDEPVFHHEWERRAFALTLASGFLGKWNIDMSRYARELMPPAEYLATTLLRALAVRASRSCWTTTACVAAARELAAPAGRRRVARRRR